MSSISSSSSLRLFSSKLLLSRPRLPSQISSPLPSRSILFSSPISFQSLPKSSPFPRPLRAQRQERQQPAADDPAAFDVSLLPPKLREIVDLFRSVPEPKAKYQQLLHYGTRLPPLDPAFKNDEHRVRGCVSQVWVRAFVDPDDAAAVRFEADSDSALTKGLAALLVLGLSGSPPAVIARLPPEFVHLLGLRQSLTPSRNNGFLNMLKLMQQKALQLYMEISDYTKNGNLEVEKSGVDAKDEILEKDSDSSGTEAQQISRRDKVSGVNGSADPPPSYPVTDDKEERSEEDIDGIGAGSVNPHGGRRVRMIQTLERGLSPIKLELEDISHQHAGHAGVRGRTDGETHFNLTVISEVFEGKTMVKRHRLVYELLKEELQSGLHALSIDAKTPSEVQSS